MQLTAVQMIGTQRSGSNLLRLMLNQLPEVSAPHPPHMIERFMPLLPLYGDLQIRSNFKRLVSDVCELVGYNPVAWTNADLDVDRIISLCRQNTLPEIARVIYETKTIAEGAHIWICKSMANIHYADELESSIKPLYLFLYRDGRDVACSFQKAVVGEKHSYFIAKQWCEEQEKCLALKEALHSNRFLSVCYENLIKEPQKELKRICSFIGATYTEDCLQYYRSGEAQNTASSGTMWQNVRQQVMADNCNKYRKELSEQDILLFEQVAGKTLQKLGYVLDSEDSHNAYEFSRSEIAFFDSVNKQWKVDIKMKQTPEEANRRKQQDVFLQKLKHQTNHFVYPSGAGIEL